MRAPARAHVRPFAGCLESLAQSTIIGGLETGASLAAGSSVLLSLRDVCRSCRGLSVTEVTTILTALTILSGVAAPAVSDYVEDAKLVRARSDVRTIAVSLVRLFNDVGTERARQNIWVERDLLVGAGEIPETSGAEAGQWGRGTDPGRVGRLDDHLINNRAGYPPLDPRARTGWRGAYLQDPVSADPWGHRYEVNVAALRSHHYDTVVLSAGRDGVVQSAFERDGLLSANDDIVAIVSSSGMGR